MNFALLINFFKPYIIAPFTTLQEEETRQMRMKTDKWDVWIFFLQCKVLRNLMRLHTWIEFMIYNNYIYKNKTINSNMSKILEHQRLHVFNDGLRK